MPGVGSTYPLPPQIVQFTISIRYQDLLAGTRLTLVLSTIVVDCAAEIEWDSVDSLGLYLYEYYTEAVREVPLVMKRGYQFVGASTACKGRSENGTDGEYVGGRASENDAM